MRKRRSAAKRQMLSCRWRLTLTVQSERHRRKVTMARKRQTSDTDSPTQVTTFSAELSCG